MYHGEDAPEIFSRGGRVSAERRDVRERFREDAERHYETLIVSLLDAVDGEVTRWGDCPGCGRKVPVLFPDVRARTAAIEMLVDQGYGRTAQQVRVEGVIGPGPEQLRRWLELMTDEERRVFSAFIDRVTSGSIVEGEARRELGRGDNNGRPGDE